MQIYFSKYKKLEIIETLVRLKKRKILYEINIKNKIVQTKRIIYKKKNLFVAIIINSNTCNMNDT